ncbi:MAG: hypothetical protein C0483_01045 [Pirellula sp.]|nr:hypothetical protein [Pirellula sp.]
MRQTPKQARHGHVFKLVTKYRQRRPTEWTVSEIVAKIGKTAHVKVNMDTRTGKVKFASAHDFRRPFGERWAAKVMPRM